MKNCKGKRIIRDSKKSIFALQTKNLFLRLVDISIVYVLMPNVLIMLKKLIVIALSLTVFVSSAQEKSKKAAMPDIPGSFIIDFGFNRAINPPDKFSQDFWGSRTVNVYYRYPVRFGRTKFSVIPSIGLSLERYKFSNNFTLDRTPASDGTYPLFIATTQFPNTTIIKSMLVTNYLELPIGFRYDTKPEDIASSVSFELGGRVGVLYQSFTKVKYEENGETKKAFDEQRHGLNSLRYGLYGRFGIGGFNFFTFYNLSPTFEANKGPGKTTMNSFTFGISINGF